jgi:DNA mismatch repair protein MLH1
MDPAKIDVNVHPTKSEVHFLHEDEVVDAIVAAVDKALAGANASRSFTVQTLLPGAEALTQRDRGDRADRVDRGEASGTAGPSQKRGTAPNYKVRMDPTNRTLHSMLAVADPSQLAAYDEPPAKRRGVTDDVVDLVDEDEATPMWSAGAGATATAADERGKEVPESVCDFMSIQELRRAVRKGASQGEPAKNNVGEADTSPELMETVSKHAFVGVVDRRTCLSLMQHSTRLLLVNHATLG